MQVDEYQDLSKRTIAEDTTLAILALGLCGEAGEVRSTWKFDFNQEPIVDELGDVAFYLAGCATILDVNLSHCLDPNVRGSINTADLLSSCCFFAEIAKKISGHGASPDDFDIDGALSDIYANLSAMADHAGSSIEEVFDHNVDKLRKRYPNGFEKRGASADR